MRHTNTGGANRPPPFLLLGAYTELQAVTFNDGLTHIIDSDNSYPFEQIVVSDGPGSTTTTVIVVTGGQASGIDASENSVITLDGGNLTAPIDIRDNVELSFNDGSVTQINALANSRVWVSGGTPSELNCENCSYLNVSGGLFTLRLNIHNLDYGEVSGGSMYNIFAWSSELHFFGGEVTNQLSARGTSIIDIFAGDILNNFHISDDSKANVYGGYFPDGLIAHDNGQINVTGGTFDRIRAFDTSKIILTGYGLNYPDGNITDISGTLTGFLDDGTPINIDFGRATTATITLNSVPVAAAFMASPLAGVAPLSVSFTDESTGSIDSWYWDFGDGNDSTLQNPTHTYDFDGTYSVSITVMGDSVSDEETKTDYIAVVSPDAPDLNCIVKEFHMRKFGEKIVIKLLVENSGNTKANPFDVAFHLSENGITPDEFLLEKTVNGGLKPGHNKVVRFAYLFPESISGKYIRALIDSNDAVLELDETNNTVLIRVP